MPMSLRSRSTHPQRAQRRLQQLALILSLLWMLKTQVKAEEYWAFLPNPPVLHPVTWEDTDFVPVYVNNTQVLGPPSTGHILPMSAKYNYTGLSTTPPICFSLKSGKCIFISRYTDWDGNFTNGLHWGVDMLYLHRNVSTTTAGLGSPPSDIPVCKQRTPPQSQWGPTWRICHLNHTVCDQGICDWSDYREETYRPMNLLYGIWTRNNRTYQTMLWKAVASLQYVTVAKRQVAWMHIGTQDAISVDGSQKNVSIIACVPDPFAFVAGDLRLVQNAMYNLTCHDCILTNCLNSSLNVSSFAIVKQPAFSFVPVNLTVPWFNDPGYAVIRAANEIILARSKRFVGMLIAGITALVTLIATAATATIALTEGIQTAEFVNELSHNVSVTFQTQEDWDQKIEQKLNALYDTVRVVGEELNSLEVRSSLKCHAMFSHICVTPFPYNSTAFPWDKIQSYT
ncbi:endogenous retrovirus group K member 25 Env polyprotein-like [Glossophaga mutica]